MVDVKRVSHGGRTYQVRINLDDSVIIDRLTYDCKKVDKTWKGQTDCSGLIHGRNLPETEILEALESAMSETV